MCRWWDLPRSEKTRIYVPIVISIYLTFTVIGLSRKTRLPVSREWREWSRWRWARMWRKIRRD